MKRILLLACLAIALAATGRVPTDEDRMNRFAEAYNVYTENLHQGRVDLRMWERVERRWREMTE